MNGPFIHSFVLLKITRFIFDLLGPHWWKGWTRKCGQQTPHPIVCGTSFITSSWIKVRKGSHNFNHITLFLDPILDIKRKTRVYSRNSDKQCLSRDKYCLSTEKQCFSDLPIRPWVLPFVQMYSAETAPATSLVKLITLFILNFIDF